MREKASGISMLLVLGVAMGFVLFFAQPGSAQAGSLVTANSRIEFDDPAGFTVCATESRHCTTSELDGSFTLTLPAGSSVSIWDTQTPPRAAPLIDARFFSNVDTNATVLFLRLDPPLGESVGTVSFSGIAAAGLTVCPTGFFAFHDVELFLRAHGDEACQITDSAGEYSYPSEFNHVFIPGVGALLVESSFSGGPVDSVIETAVVDGDGRPLDGVEACFVSFGITNTCSSTDSQGLLRLSSADYQGLIAADSLRVFFRDPEDRVAADIVDFSVECQSVVDPLCVGTATAQSFPWSDRESQELRGETPLSRGVLLTAIVEANGTRRPDATIRVDVPPFFLNFDNHHRLTQLQHVGDGVFQGRIPTVAFRLVALSPHGSAFVEPPELTNGTDVDILIDLQCGASDLDCDGIDDQCGAAGDVNCDGLVRVAILGDSYISGEGTGNFITGTDTEVRLPLLASESLTDEQRDEFRELAGNKCHRSTESWAYETAVSLGATRETIEFLACSGATTNEMFSDNDFTRGFEQAQLAALRDSAQDAPFDFVLISIGGNDAGFGELLRECGFGFSSCTSSTGLVTNIQTRVAGAVSEVLGETRSIVGDDVPIFHIGYPDPLRPVGLCSEIGAFVSPLTTDTQGNVGTHRLITLDEQRFVSEEFLPELNGRLELAAIDAGVNFVNPSTWFEGHSICPPDGNEQFANGFKLGNDVFLFEQDSFHPTAAGYDEIARRFAQLHIQNGRLATADNPDPQNLGLADTTDGPQAIAVYQTPDGGVYGWTSDGYGVSVQNAGPGQVVVVSHFSVPSLAATGIVGADGSVQIQVPIVEGLPPGLHTTQVTLDGQVLSTDLFEVEIPEECDTRVTPQPDIDGDLVSDVCDPSPHDGPLADVDGDRVFNSEDNCPLVPNPDQASASNSLLGEVCVPGTPGAELRLTSDLQIDQPIPSELSLVVRASGETGEEVLAVRVGGELVGEFDVSSSFVDYEVSLPVGTAVTDVEVAFINDAVRGDFDRNLIVDYIELDGVRFDTEAESTSSTGTWNRSSCAPSSVTVSETLHCNGHFTYGGSAPVQPSDVSLVVRASGETGEEVLAVRVGGVLVGEFEVSSAFADYEVSLPAGSTVADVEVAFINDAVRGDFDRNLIVDYVEFDGVRFETEAESTSSTGTWNSATRCAPSSVTVSETLHCNGHFTYGT